MRKGVYLIFVLTIIWSCSSSSDDNGGSNPSNGNINGSVSLFDEGNTQVDNSGMTVSVEGSAAFQTTTDNSGNFSLTGIPFGNYTLEFSKTGYGTYKVFNVSHNSSNTTISESPSLGQMSTTSVIDLTSGTSNNGSTIVLGATTDPAGSSGNTKYIQFFFASNSNVSSTNYDVVLDAISTQTNPYNLNLTSAALIALGLESGQTVYVKCYGTSFWDNQYDDPGLGRTIFPNLNSNSASAVSFVVP